MAYLKMDEHLEFCRTLAENTPCTEGKRINAERAIGAMQEVLNTLSSTSEKLEQLYSWRNELINLISFVYKNSLNAYEDFSNMVLMNFNADLNHDDRAYERTKEIIQIYRINPANHCPHCGKKLSPSQLRESMGKITSHKCAFCGGGIIKNSNFISFFIVFLLFVCLWAVQKFTHNILLTFLGIAGVMALWYLYSNYVATLKKY